MHELSFAEQILENVERIAREHAAGKVIRIRLSIGEMLGLNKESLTFCLGAVTAGTILAGARIEFEEKRAEVDCPRCGRLPVDPVGVPMCPLCGQRGRFTSGTELIIEEIELDEPDAQA